MIVSLLLAGPGAVSIDFSLERGGPQCRSHSHRWKTRSSSSRRKPRPRPLPDNAKEKPQQGEVLAVGPGRRNDAGERIPVDVKVGDKVLYSKYGGTEVHYQGEDYLIVSARDILAILG